MPRLFFFILPWLAALFCSACCSKNIGSLDTEPVPTEVLSERYSLLSAGIPTYNNVNCKIDLVPDWERKVNSFDGQYYYNRNTVGMDFVFIPNGSFWRGSPEQEEFAVKNEWPCYEISISKAFFIGVTEITQRNWDTLIDVMKKGDFAAEQIPLPHKSAFKAPERPVDTVSWLEVQDFIAALNLLEKTTKYRLPTEAEWEYVARAGHNGAYCFGDDSLELLDYGWHRAQLTARSQLVAQLKANRWGVFDMHGNVWEWVSDCFEENYYSATRHITVDPQGPVFYKQDTDDEVFLERVKRGGSWGVEKRFLRSAYRGSALENEAFDCLGFRLVREFGY